MQRDHSAVYSVHSLLSKKYWYFYALFGIAVLSFALNFYAISKMGYGNAYYAAAIKSMTQSPQNFFFLSFDPAGMVSVDKPPLGLWVQVLFVMIFGYHGWAMLLPQALAGTGSCLMMYVLVAKRFGRSSGLISALAFALTPAVVVASRNNTMDMQLIFVLLIAVWFLFRAIEKTKWRDLFMAALFVGLGFNIKMLQAYMILPAVGLVYLLFSKEKMGRRILASVISLVVVAVVSLSWGIAVDLYPLASRPYVGSSTNNTVMELMIGHNGLERIYGQSMGGNRIGGGGQNGQGRPQGTGGRNRGNQNNGANGTPPTGNNPNGNIGGTAPGGFNRSGRTVGAVGNDIGTAGPLRLWDSTMLGQASWLIVFELFGILACVRKFRYKERTPAQGMFAFWSLWLLTMYGFFSFASFFHRYYLCMMAPGIAGLVGIGLVQMVKQYRDKNGWKQWLLPISLLATSGGAVAYVWSYVNLRTWLVPLIILFAVAAIILMLASRKNSSRLALLFATGCMLVSILAGPFYWSLTAALYVPENVTMPYAGPELASQTKTQGMTANQEAFVTTDSQTLALEKYLVANYKEGSYLVVSQRANDVAELIVDTGLPAVAYGGFLGTDQTMSLDKLKQLVSDGKVTYFLVAQQSGFGGSSSSEITSYVKENAKLINPTQYSASSGQSDASSGYALYCFGS